LAEPDFNEFTRPLVGMRLTHIWRGYGSAIFLNFGELHHRLWKTGRLSWNPCGEMSISLTWSWRIEGRRRIWLGSWSDEEKWQKFFDKMVGATVKEVKTFARLAEIDVELSCGLHVVSFMTAEGDPEWAIHDGRGAQGQSISIIAGRLRIQTDRTNLKRVKASDVCILPKYSSRETVATADEND
jgi:hypothetical protein